MRANFGYDRIDFILPLKSVGGMEDFALKWPNAGPERKLPYERQKAVDVFSLSLSCVIPTQLKFSFPDYLLRNQFFAHRAQGNMITKYLWSGKI